MTSQEDLLKLIKETFSGTQRAPGPRVFYAGGSVVKAFRKELGDEGFVAFFKDTIFYTNDEGIEIINEILKK